jgi:hypothetical protein
MGEVERGAVRARAGQPGLERTFGFGYFSWSLTFPRRPPKAAINEVGPPLQFLLSSIVWEASERATRHRQIRK